MIYLIPLFLLPAILLAEPVCKKCEVIREYNKSHPGDFEYYDDYLKSQKNGDAKEAPKAEEKK